MTLWNALDWVATILSLYSIWLITDLKKTGFLVGVTSSIIWIAIGINSNLIGLLVLNFVIIVIYIKGYFTWRKKYCKNIEVNNISPVTDTQVLK
jgi:nicotinamide riboside transporter PnuC